MAEPETTKMFKAGLKSGTTLCNGKYRYRILKPLGQGGFGITYLAKMIVPNEFEDVEVDVAIKEFFLSRINTRQSDGVSLASTQSPDFIYYRKKFKKEAVKLSKLSQFDDIVKVHEIFDENGTTYYSMRYIDGCNFDAYINQRNKLVEKQSIEYVKAIARALQHLHQNYMVHLDLNPRNIMRSNEGKLFLIDFGLSKQYDDSGNAVSTTTNSIGGLSRGYAPPEQYNENFDGVFAPTLDIYALGATFYKMLTGETPKESIFIRDYSSLRTKMSDCGISTNTIAVVEKAMNFDKDGRYQSVDEFIDAFSDVYTSIGESEYVEVDPEYDEDDRSIRTPDKTLRKEKTDAKEAVAEFNRTSSTDETQKSDKTELKSSKEINSEGMKHWEAKDYQKSFDLFCIAAQQGYPQAQYNLGNSFANGWGVPKSLESAVICYRMAKDNGSEKAKKQYEYCRSKMLFKCTTIFAFILLILVIVMAIVLNSGEVFVWGLVIVFWIISMAKVVGCQVFDDKYKNKELII